MIYLQSCGLFGALLSFIPAALALVPGGDYECSISNTGKLTVTFRIDNTKYDDLCDQSSGVSGKPFFLSKPTSSGTFTKMCDLATDIRISCNFVSGTSGCGCTGSNVNGHYVIEYNADTGYDPFWKASINCLDSNLDPVLSFTQRNCEPIPPPPTTSPPTESTTSPPPTDNVTTSLTMSTSNSTTAVSKRPPTTTEGSGQNVSHKNVAIGVGAGFAGLAVMVAIVTVLVLKCRGKTQKQKLNNDRHTNDASSPKDRTSRQHETEM